MSDLTFAKLNVSKAKKDKKDDYVPTKLQLEKVKLLNSVARLEFVLRNKDTKEEITIIDMPAHAFETTSVGYAGYSRVELNTGEQDETGNDIKLVFPTGINMTLRNSKEDGASTSDYLTKKAAKAAAAEKAAEEDSKKTARR